ncbi:hypothetical protein ciss_01530 [Carboxydothermus islandicus]|uniref:Uncharacterized protein n=1 Tax=Carboxydothermus islandicus TaxID=661089 RepID=A0A1L8CZ76_9THEO|nr:hypothetical protein [Carboxydothermus islandicus]GAV24220.1 hypothetical protein ciss_01530 [Carboxydothermus islandicus]
MVAASELIGPVAGFFASFASDAINEASGTIMQDAAKEALQYATFANAKDILSSYKNVKNTAEFFKTTGSNLVDLTLKYFENKNFYGTGDVFYIINKYGELQRAFK